jgi:predicted tellurium resistance membrane protein TerC
MISAILLAAAIMIFASGAISRFVEQHPTMKMLALSFLILIGSLLVIEGIVTPETAESLHLHNYAYFAMAFSFAVELINMRLRKPAEPVKLHNQPALTDQGMIAGD